MDYKNAPQPLNRGKILAGLLVLISMIVTAQTPTWQWARQAGINSSNYTYSVCTDAAGNVYMLAGYMSDSITVGDSTFLNGEGGGSTLLLVKYNTAGNIIWARTATGFNNPGVTGPMTCNPACVTTDELGNVYITGSFYSSGIVFGHDTLLDPNNIQFDIFLVKYDNSGNVLWVRTSGGTNGTNANGVSADRAGNVYITGSFTTNTVFDTIFLTTNYEQSEVFTVKYDSAGRLLWAKCPLYNHPRSTVIGTGIAVDAAGNAYVTGYFEDDSISFDTVVVYNSYPGSDNPFLVKYDANGNALWTRATGAVPCIAKATGIALDNGGRPAITGYSEFSPMMVFGTDTISNNFNGASDIFVVKYDAQGNVLWANTAGGPDGAAYQGKAITCDAEGNWYVAVDNMQSAYVTLGADSVTLGCESCSQPYTQGFFIVKYDTAGKVIWTEASGTNNGSTNATHVNGITVDNRGAAYIVGNFEEPEITVGPFSLTSAGGSVDIFIAKLDSAGDEPADVNMVYGAANRIRVFPNPSSGVFEIVRDNEHTRLTVSDVTGRQVISNAGLNAPISQIDLSGAESGVYFFSFVTSTGRSVARVVLSK